MFVVGIDGGGTKTRVAVCASDGTLLRRETLGAFNLSDIGEDGFRRRVEEILAFCGDMSACGAMCAGGAGVSGTAAGEILHAALVRRGFAGKLLLCGDHEIALAGAMKEPGCVLIAGTGSICCGKNAAGEAFRCGGGGHIIDDPGSGYALGRDALTAALQTEDGRLSENPLHGAVMSAVGGNGIQGIFDFVYFSHRGKGDIAALAPLVLRCAEQGDTVSLDILRRGAGELARLVRSAMEHLRLEKGAPCALAGGLLAEDNIYRRAVCEKLASFCRPVFPEHDALHGAVQLALDAVK